ncbi:MAG: nucleotidyltransferase family protein [Burkholderiaceae bacterium]
MTAWDRAGGACADDGRRRALAGLARGTPWFLDALRAARALGLADWCIGAGAVRNLAWDALHGHATPSALADVDLAFFDAGDLSAAREQALQARVQASCPSLRWEVTNQAAVHTWFESCFGHAVAPLRSLEEAVASWPEFATAVGVTLAADDTIRVIAPHGLDDLFAMVVRRNPARVSLATYRERVAAKRYPGRWPRVTVIEE